MEIIKTIKVGLALLFVICLLDMPYGYYELVRFCGMAGFLFLAYSSYGDGKQNHVVIYVLLALLFQPLFKIALGRTLWNVVDVVVAIGLCASLFSGSKKED